MTNQRVLFLELNEATEFFLRKYISEGLLPNFKKLLDEGHFLKTHIPYFEESDPRFRRNISPWIIWPTIYTGLMPEEHGLVGFGKSTKHLKGKYIWDILDQASIPCGIFGSLMSFPPRGNHAFYLPEFLADAPTSHPSSLQALQKLFLFAARNYSQNFISSAAKALSLLMKAIPQGIKFETVLRILFQQPAEWLIGDKIKPERAMLHSYISSDVFFKLYSTHLPQFATLHLNHLAYMQHRFWRAAEPNLFKSKLSSTDKRFYNSSEERQGDEAKHSERIRQAYCWTDLLVGKLMDILQPNGTLMIATGPGQRPYDPVDEIHNPVVKLIKSEKLFKIAGLKDFTVLHQMNPDLTLNFRNEKAAKRAELIVAGFYIDKHVPLFFVTLRDCQLFLELQVPPIYETNNQLFISHKNIHDICLPASHFIWLSDNNEQSTTNHEEEGLLFLWGNGCNVDLSENNIDVHQIAPLILKQFNLNPANWHNPYVK